MASGVTTTASWSGCRAEPRPATAEVRVWHYPAAAPLAATREFSNDAPLLLVFVHVCACSNRRIEARSRHTRGKVPPEPLPLLAPAPHGRLNEEGVKHTPAD